MAVASTVTVNITAETAKFENGLKKAKKSAKGFGGIAAAGFKIAGAAAAGLTLALIGLTKASLKTVDAQRKTARTLGTTQRVFAGLSLAAGISGVSVGSFEKALKKQQKAIVDANDGLLTQQRAFDRLGLSAKDLIKLPVEDQFKKITTALGEVDNATLKVGIASDIFGAKNTDLINVLELGEAGLDGFIKKVDELGVAMTDKQTKAIEESNDAILVMKTAFVGLGNQIAARVSPTITAVAGYITNLTSRVTNAIPKWTAWAASIFGVNRELSTLGIKDLDAEIKQLTEDTGDLVDRRDRLEAFGRQFNNGVPAGTQIQIDELNADILVLTERYLAARDAREKLFKAGEIQVPDPTGGDPDADAPVGGLDADNFQKDFDKATAAVANASEALQAKLQTIRESLANNPLWTEELAGKQAAAAIAAYLKPFEAIQDADAAFIQSQKDAAESATRAVATPAEELALRIAEIREQLETNPYWSPETAARQSKEAAEAYLEGIKEIEVGAEDVFKNLNAFQEEAARNAQDIFAEFLFDPFETGLDGMLKSFIDMLRKMIAQLIASKVLTYFLSLYGGGVPASTGAVSSGGGLGPPAAIGGTRPGGQSLLVGERGPELFTPGASGAIRPMGSASFDVTTNINGGDNLSIATLIPILEENNRKVKGEMLEAFDRGSFA